MATREVEAERADAGARDVAAWTLVAGSSILVLVGACFVVAVAGLAVGVGIGPWVIGPAVAIQAAFTYLAWRTFGENQLARRVVVVVLAIWVTLVALGFAEHSIADTTTDGKHYHQDAVVALADGWNPLRDAEIPSTPTDTYLKTDTYPKAPWIVDAIVLRTTHDIAASKLPGAALALAAILVAVSVFSAAGFAIRPAIGLAVLLAANPVALSEFWTLMVDGILASLLVCALSFALLFLWKRASPRITVPALAVSLVLIVNTKHTGALFVIVVVGGVAALVGRRRRDRSGTRRLLAITAACLVVGVVALGANPYVTNFIRHHHNPLYPVYGPGTVDITHQYKVGGMQGKSAPERLVIAIVSQTAGAVSNPHPKVPFTFTTAEWNAFRTPGSRSGGWGPLFSGALLLLGAAGVTLVVRRRKCTLPAVAIELLIAAGCALLVTVVMPDSFVARFAPAFWLVPALAVPALLLVSGDQLVRRLSVAAIIVLTINAVGIAVDSSLLHQQDSSRAAASLRRLSREKEPLAATFFGGYRNADAYNLRNAHVHFEESSTVQCDTPLVYSVDGVLRSRPASKLPSTGVAFCNANGGNLGEIG
jgi:hypothetical protein